MLKRGLDAIVRKLAYDLRWLCSVCFLAYRVTAVGRLERQLWVDVSLPNDSTDFEGAILSTRWFRHRNLNVPPSLPFGSFPSVDLVEQAFATLP
jgi:hypothetical protein